jgi:4-hydroxy-3-methylbut-2-enyl diphosphate reductase
MGYANDCALVINPNRMKKNFRRFKRLGVVAQTTLNIEAFRQVIGKLVEKVDELKVFNTICHATAQVQKDTLELAKKVDLMIVVGGHNSANTTRLAKLCKSLGTSTHHIETAKELKASWFKGKTKVGVTGGTSTPDWLIREVVKEVKKYN